MDGNTERERWGYLVIPHVSKKLDRVFLPVLHILLADACIVPEIFPVAVASVVGLQDQVVDSL